MMERDEPIPTSAGNDEGANVSRSPNALMKTSSHTDSFDSTLSAPATNLPRPQWEPTRESIALDGNELDDTAPNDEMAIESQRRTLMNTAGGLWLLSLAVGRWRGRWR
jgi:hypothetical protein